MSGPANAWAEFVTDRKKQIGAQLVETATAIQDALLSTGEVLFSLDKSSSFRAYVYARQAAPMWGQAFSLPPAFSRRLEFLHFGTDFLTVPPRVDQAEAHALYQGMASAVPLEAVTSGL